MYQEALADKEINLQNDTMFKSLMTNPNCKEMISNVINELTGLDKDLLLKGNYYIGGEELGRRNNQKYATNINIKVKNHLQIVLGMNRVDSEHHFERNVIYALSKIVDPTILDWNFGNVIIINFDSYNYYKTDEPILVFQARDKEGNIETKNFKSIHIILDNFKENTSNVGEKIKKLARFLQEEKTLSEFADEYKDDEEYMPVINTIEELYKDPEFVEDYVMEEERHPQAYMKVKS